MNRHMAVYTNPTSGESLTAREWGVKLRLSSGSFYNRLGKNGVITAKTFLTKKEMRKQRYTNLAKQDIGNEEWRSLSKRTPPRKEWRI